MNSTSETTGISSIVSNKIACPTSRLTPCVDKGNGSGRGQGIDTAHISYLAPPRRSHRNRLKRGRPKEHWSKRAVYQRRHCPGRLRRCDVENLLAADRFASVIGRRLETFITLRWFLTRDGEINIRGRWSALLNALRIWASRRGFELAHCWVHENPPRGEPAFNSHLLANVPPEHREALRAWLLKHLGAFEPAIDIQPRTCIHWNKPDRRISYLCKGTDRATAMKYRLITEKGWDFNQGIVPFQRSGTSRNINATARIEFQDQYAPAREETRFLTVDNGSRGAT